MEQLQAEKRKEETALYALKQAMSAAVAQHHHHQDQAQIAAQEQVARTQEEASEEAAKREEDELTASIASLKQQNEAQARALKLQRKASEVVSAI